MNEKILSIGNKKEEKILRRSPKAFDFSKIGRKEITALLARMRQIMREANGVGLAANQIGLECRLFVAEVPDQRGNLKFYAVFNPSIEKSWGEKIVHEEGCLSVPGTYGEVERRDRVLLRGFDQRGKPIKIKAWGLLARVFQHEVDHLHGKLFIDRAERLYKLEKRQVFNDRQAKAV